MKILIISTFFPPTKLTPSERIFSWAKYFKKFGLHPIVITRIWPEDTSGYHSSLQNAGSEIIVKKYEDYEVHYLPYENDLNEKLALKWGKTRWHFLYRIFLFLNYFIEPLLLFKISPFYKKLFQYALQIIKKEKISKVLISGAPFMLFKVGYALKQKLRTIQVYADYRDDWTTSDICFNPNNVKALEIVRSYLKRFEKKWLSVYELFFTVSDNYVEKIHELIGIPGYVAENGYMSENYTAPSASLYDTFTVTYIGYLYNTQPIEIFLEAVKKLVDVYGIHIKVQFVGIKNQEQQVNRILSHINGYEKYFDLMPRIGKEECIVMQNRSHALLQVGHKGIKGSPGSKMYEYLALKKPVILCPTDQDIVEQTLTESKQAFMADDVDTCCQQILKLKDIYDKGIDLSFNNEFINRFDRRNIAEKMAHYILQ